jgi:hypothetical protein
MDDEEIAVAQRGQLPGQLLAVVVAHGGHHAGAELGGQRPGQERLGEPRKSYKERMWESRLLRLGALEKALEALDHLAVADVIVEPRCSPPHECVLLVRAGFARIVKRPYRAPDTWIVRQNY